MKPPPASRSDSCSTIVCTIAAKNYLAHVRALMRSLAQHQADYRLVTLVVDQNDGCFDPEVEPFEVQFAADLDIPRWAHMSMKYEITELSTAVKPYFLERLFSASGAEKVIYLDPDIVAYRPLDQILKLLDDHGVLLTPHILQPLNDDKSPSELDFLRVGTFNLGFLALARHGPWEELLHWWQDKLYSGCVRDIESGLFVDQHWMDLAPSLFEGVHILRDPGHNLAYWNFKTRDLERNGDDYTVSGQPLTFFHFSGFEFDNLERVSKYQNRFSLSQLNNEYRTCFESYHRLLEEQGHEEVSQWPYSFAAFSDGVPVSDVLRSCLREHDPMGYKWPDPWDLTDPACFRNWVTRLSKKLGSGLLSPYSVTLYKLRPDLQRAFPQTLSGDDQPYASWLASQKGAAFNAAYVKPIADALEGGDTSTVADPPRGDPRGSFFLRSRMALRYFKAYPENVAPNIPALAADLPPPVYTGPPGFYRWIRHQFVRLGVLQRARKLIGLRWILTVRYFFTYPVEPGVSALVPVQVAAPCTREREGVEDVLSELRNSRPMPGTASEQGVNLAGYFGADTGVGQMGRATSEALESAGLPVARLALDRPEAKGPSADLPYPISLFSANADEIPRVFATLPLPALSRTYRIGYWYWELSFFPLTFADRFDLLHEIWAPSRFCHQAYEVVSTIPVRYVPPYLPPPGEVSGDRERFGLDKDRFYFFFAFDVLSVPERKNPVAAIEALRRLSHRTDKPVGLVLKVAGARSAPELMRGLRAEAEDLPIVFVTERLSRLEMNKLVASTDAILSLHRSEGLGLLMAEGLYLDKPVIATAYGGVTDFLDRDTGFPVAFALEQLSRDYGPYPKGSIWADPSVDDATRQMLRVLADPHEAIRRTRRGKERIRKTYGLTAASARFARELERIAESLEGERIKTSRTLAGRDKADSAQSGRS